MLHRIAVVLGCILSCSSAFGQTTNAWESASSGNWEDMRWSLGELPGEGQMILVTNSGWKAVAIGPNTAMNFPQTLNPYAITLTSPADSRNLLLLNYAGFAAPLSTSQLIVGTNAELTMLSSSLNVNNGMGGSFSIGGTFNQGDFSTVSTARLNVGDVGPGIYNLTNGTLLVSDTQTVGGNFASFFKQFGGTNFAERVILAPGGEYDLYGGQLSTRALYWGLGGTFRQLGGVVKPDRLAVETGTYALEGGFFSSTNLDLPAPLFGHDYFGGASFTQTGGTNLTDSLNLGLCWPAYFNVSPWGHYTLSNGVLMTTSTSLGPWGGFYQMGGTHMAGSLNLNGDQTSPYGASYAEYNLNGGMLAARSLNASVANIRQIGGTNQIAGDLRLNWKGSYGSLYDLSGGMLFASNNVVNCSVYSASGFLQSGGTQIVSNLLTISRSDASASSLNPYALGFVLSGGQLNAPNIRVENGATFHHASGTLVNSGRLILAGGIWEARPATQQFGALALDQGSNSSIVLPAGNANLQFGSSSSVSWGSASVLVIENWNGAVSGNGAHQIRFGTTAAALTPSQIAQIQFRNPSGTAGLYPATILATGEIVPARFLASRKISGSMQISWAAGMILQSSPDIAGPYVDMKGVANPYTVSFSEPHRFFRLRN